jgi:hypothetical protein
MRNTRPTPLAFPGLLGRRRIAFALSVHERRNRETRLVGNDAFETIRSFIKYLACTTPRRAALDNGQTSAETRRRTPTYCAATYATLIAINRMRHTVKIRDGGTAQS